MTMVMFAMSLTIYEIFANQVKCQKFVPGSSKMIIIDNEKNSANDAIQLEMFDSDYFQNVS